MTKLARHRVGPWLWDPDTKVYSRQYKPGVEDAVLVRSLGTTRDKNGGIAYRLAYEIRDIDGDLLDAHHRLRAEYLVSKGGNWGEVVTEVTVALELIANVEILPEDRVAGMGNVKILEVLERRYDLFYEDRLASLMENSEDFYDRKGNLHQAPYTTWPGLHAQSDIEEEETMSKVNEFGTKSSSTLVTEGLEMGAVSAVIENGAKRLVEKMGADPSNPFALHMAKLGMVLFLRNVGLGLLGDNIPKREFVERRLDIALQGVAATASFEATRELTGLMGPILEMLQSEGPALIKLLSAPGFDTNEVPATKTPETVSVETGKRSRKAS